MRLSTVVRSLKNASQILLLGAKQQKNIAFHVQFHGGLPTCCSKTNSNFFERATYRRVVGIGPMFNFHPKYFMGFFCTVQQYCEAWLYMVPKCIVCFDDFFFHTRHVQKLFEGNQLGTADVKENVGVNQVRYIVRYSGLQNNMKKKTYKKKSEWTSSISS